MNNASVPLVNIEPFLKGDDEARATVAKTVDHACKEIGFLIIEGHGVCSNLVENMYRVSHDYFSLPYWEKISRKMPPDCYRGYTAFESETLALSLDKKSPPDLKESFSCGPFNSDYDEYHFGQNGQRFFAPNVWPERPMEMKNLWEQYYSEMEMLAANLMQIFAVALNLPETWFDDKIDKQIANFSAIFYPPLTAEPSSRQLRGGEHTDYGSLTIVHTNTDIGGLEVKHQNGEWISVPWKPNTFVVNLGDLMAEWTNDMWVSTMHRVTNPPSGHEGKSKTSLCFFHQPNYDAVVECIPTCINTERPARYSSTTSGEHVTSKVIKHRQQAGG